MNGKQLHLGISSVSSLLLICMDKFKLCVELGNKAELSGINISFFQLTEAVNNESLLAEVSY